MDPQVSALAAELSNAIETILNPSSSQNDRQNAHKICEEFKESSPFCVPVGLVLAEKSYKPVIRHFGLQLLEHAIKFRWIDMKTEEKEYLKTNALQFMANGTLGILEEEFHIKDAVARITVELAKREWPQLWPSLQEDLYKLCQMGETQTELVLKVYLRLVEDAVLLQTIPQQRRREIMLGLTANMKDLFEMFVQFLRVHTDLAEKCSDPQESKAHLRVSEAVLYTLAGYLDWVSMSLIFTNNSVLLQMLCLLLGNSSLQLLAAECLLTIVGRKGKVEERKPLLVLFSDEAMKIILSTAAAAEKSSAHDEYYYLFLKKLCLVLIDLGKQVCALWGVVPDCEQPPNFAMYLEALMAFTQHPSQILSSYTQSVWLSFMKHEFISKDAVLLSFIPKLFETSSKMLLKVGFPSKNNSPSCDYSRQDFDSDEDFSAFFSRYRSEVADTVRQAVLLQPELAFNFAKQWLETTMCKPIETGTDAGELCNLSSPSFLEWDAMTLFIESVMSRIGLTDFTPDPDVGVALLKSALAYQSQDPLILSSLLSCLSALVIFLKYSTETIPAMLEKIFSGVTFAFPGQNKSNRSRSVKNVRQHACSMLVTICKTQTDLIFPVFDELYRYIQNISRDTEQLSQMEKCILTEALILVCNRFNNYEKQSIFLEEILQPAKELWLSEQFKLAFSGADKWMSYIGLDQAPVEPSSEDTCGINRSHITYCITMLMAVLKRSKWPEEIQVAENGGFVLLKKEDGSLILKNPATVHVSRMLENLLLFMKSMNGSWHPEMLQRRHPEFEKSFDLVENEKYAILGIPMPSVDNTSSPVCKNPVTRMQNFLTTMHDYSCHIVGNAGQCLGYEFYAIPCLPQSLLSTVFTNLDYLPDYRTKPFIRVILKPYIINCPKDLYSVAVIPLLEFVCPYFYQKLNSQWQQINQRISEDGCEDNMETQEILEDQLTRQLTREYIDLLGMIFHKLKQEPLSDDAKMDDAENVPVSHKEEPMTDLGQMCMKCESIYPSVMMCVFGALSWRDTIACNKSVSLCWSTTRQLFSNGNMTLDIATNFLCSVIYGLQMHGQHEGPLALLLGLVMQMYELLRPSFPDLYNVLLQIPNCNPSDLKDLDAKVLQMAAQKQIMNDKKKRDAFKKLLSGVIGKSVGEEFKRETQYKDLPPIFRIKPPKSSGVLEQQEESSGLCELFSPSDD
ncbi:exportin-5-like [Saccostrea echinata]|uniref:exportin-5-like n=1 Tax=Saccostrea echinata TaxID=191078 RepID=UPI002A81DD34|nr:exportin-5-like [Saccostrea echinata]